MKNIEVDIKEFDGEASICVRTVRGRELKNIFMNFGLLYIMENFLITWETVSFSSRNVLHGVRS